MDKSKEPSGQPDVSASGEQSEENNQHSNDSDQGRTDSVRYDTYKKVLSERKRFQSEYERAQEKLKEYEERELESQGQKDKLIETYKSKASEFEKKYKTAVGSFAHKSLTEAFKTEALKAGCQSEYLDKLVKLTELPVEAIDEDFNPNFDVLKDLVEQSKKDNAVFFKTQASAPRVGTPTRGVVGKNDFSDLTTHEKAKLFAEQLLGKAKQ